MRPAKATTMPTDFPSRNRCGLTLSLSELKWGPVSTLYGVRYPRFGLDFNPHTAGERGFARFLTLVEVQHAAAFCP